MTKPTPAISIGLPVYNGENYLEKAIDSILNQTFEDFELIISDNDSSDKTSTICKAYAAKDTRVRYLKNDKNLGAAKNYNRTFLESRGKYFKWATHDDLIAPKFLEACYGILESNPDCVVSYPYIAYIDEHGDSLGVQEEGTFSIISNNPARRLSTYYQYHKLSNDVINWAVFGLFRSSALKRTHLIGNFLFSDWLLEAELSLLGQYIQYPEYYYFLRKHPQSSHRDNKTWDEQLEWFDPNRKGQIIFPWSTLLGKTLRSIHNLPLSRTSRILCDLTVLKYCLGKWKQLGGEGRLYLRHRFSGDTNRSIKA